MVARSRARYLAPIALVATIAGTYLIVHAGLTSKHTTAVHSHTVRRPSPAHRKAAQSKFYVVQINDTLTRIASKTGIPVATLEALNPNVVPNSLQTGQRLKLRQ